MFSPESFAPASFAPETFAGFDIILPPVTGGGGGAHGVDSYKRHAPKIIGDDDEDRLRAEIIIQDDEILAVIMSAVTCGALR